MSDFLAEELAALARVMEMLRARNDAAAFVDVVLSAQEVTAVLKAEWCIAELELQLDAAAAYLFEARAAQQKAEAAVGVLVEGVQNIARLIHGAKDMAHPTKYGAEDCPFLGCQQLTKLLSSLPAAVQADMERRRKVEEAKNAAYAERNRLVAALSKVFPSHLCRHDDTDKDWEDDWRWIVCVHIPVSELLLPTGNVLKRESQATWHIHNSELPLFAHLRDAPNHWDGHDTEEKYRRLALLAGEAPEGGQG